MGWKKWLVRGSLGFLAATILLVIVANNSANKKKPDVHFNVQIADGAGLSTDAISAALTAFAESCTPLTTKHWKDVQSATAVVGPVPDYAQYLVAKGWKYHIEVEIVLADKTSIPATDEYGVPDGHHLWYTLGGGATPGFFAAKRVSQAMCGMPVDQNGVKVFRELPALKALP